MPSVTILKWWINASIELFISARGGGVTLRSFTTTGIPVAAGTDLNAAAREALLAMIAHLQARYGFERPAAHALCSACVDLRASEVVDVPYPVVSALLPLDVFETEQ